MKIIGAWIKFTIHTVANIADLTRSSEVLEFDEPEPTSREEVDVTPADDEYQRCRMLAGIAALE